MERIVKAPPAPPQIREQEAGMAASCEVTATAPGMRTSTIKDRLSGPRELEIENLVPGLQCQSSHDCPGPAGAENAENHATHLVLIMRKARCGVKEER